MTIKEAIAFLSSLPDGNFKVTKLVVGFDVDPNDEPALEPEGSNDEYAPR